MVSIVNLLHLVAQFKYDKYNRVFWGLINWKVKKNAERRGKNEGRSYLKIFQAK
jgi:hypothetical protein